MNLEPHQDRVLRRILFAVSCIICCAGIGVIGLENWRIWLGVTLLIWANNFNRKP